MARPIAKPRLSNGRARLYASYVISMHVSQRVNRVILRWNPLGTISHSLLTLCGAMSNENLLVVCKRTDEKEARVLGEMQKYPIKGKLRKHPINPPSKNTSPIHCVLFLIPLLQVPWVVPLLLASCHPPCFRLLS